MRRKIIDLFPSCSIPNSDRTRLISDILGETECLPCLNDIITFDLERRLLS